VILVVWTFVNVCLLFRFGIVTDGEAEKYIREARNLIDKGSLSSSNFRMYMTEIILIFISLKFNLGYELIVALHLLFNLIATITLYRLVSSIFLPLTGLIVTLWFLLNLPLHEFNFFLQTDSLFYSFTILFSCYLLQIEKFTLKEAVLVLLSLSLISVTRPTGLLFLPPTFLYLYFRFFNAFKLSYKLLVLMVVSVAFIYFLNEAIGSGGELDFMFTARNESIICGVPTLRYFKKITEIENGNSLYGLVYYIAHNFPQFVRLSFQRSLAFFGIVRDYYTPLHNIYIILYFFPMYIMAALSMKYWIKKNVLLLLFSFSLIFFFWVTVILSCDDWHNRFILTISPYLIVLSTPFIRRLLPTNNN
jgi:hypothetical protein